MSIANINKKHKVTALGQDSCVYLTGGKKRLGVAGCTDNAERFCHQCHWMKLTSSRMVLLREYTRLWIRSIVTTKKQSTPYFLYQVLISYLDVSCWCPGLIKQRMRWVDNSNNHLKKKKKAYTMQWLLAWLFIIRLLIKINISACLIKLILCSSC